MAKLTCHICGNTTHKNNVMDLGYFGMADKNCCMPCYMLTVDFAKKKCEELKLTDTEDRRTILFHYIGTSENAQGNICIWL